MSAPTKGPWEALHGQVNQVSTGNCIAWCEMENLPFEANARLIAAAPELLAALEQYLQAGHKEARRDASQRASRVIAKVRGEK